MKEETGRERGFSVLNIHDQHITGELTAAVQLCSEHSSVQSLGKRME